MAGCQEIRKKKKKKDGYRDGGRRLGKGEKERTRENIYHQCILNISNALLSHSLSITSRSKVAEQHENKTMSYKSLRLAKVNSNNLALLLALTSRREACEAFL